MTPQEYEKLWVSVQNNKSNLEVIKNATDEQLLRSPTDLCNSTRAFARVLLTELYIRNGGLDLVDKREYDAG